jgi:hypothetical protein
MCADWRSENILNPNRSVRIEKVYVGMRKKTTKCATAAASGRHAGSLAGLSGKPVFATASRPEDSEVSSGLDQSVPRHS